jgi:hypothetical protein
MYTEDFCRFLPLWVLRLCRDEAEAREKFCETQVAKANEFDFPYRNEYELQGTEKMVNLRGARQDLATCKRVLKEEIGSGDMRYEPMRGEYRGSGGGRV